MALPTLLLQLTALRAPVDRRAILSTAAAATASFQTQPAASAPAQGSVGARVEELKALEKRAERSGAAPTASEFWPGRLQGKPPPEPKVRLKDAAPPIVIFPGFGNDQIDYIAPNEQPREVGLVEALGRRGASQVAVVPIARTNWLNVAKGLSDPNFLIGKATADGPTYGWYVAAAKKTVEEAVAARRAAKPQADPRVVLVGHSAGGWLARALMVSAGEQWSRDNIRGLVTLGAPHLTPPPEATDQTRGTITDINTRMPGAYLSPEVFYVTVSSTKVVGAAEGDPAQRNGYTAYNLLLGRAEGVAGDGFVPREAAFLDGATTLTLDCYHSGGGADPWPLDDWYGAERNVDAWLGAVAERLAKQDAKA